MTHADLIARTEHLLLMLRVHQQLSAEIGDQHPPRAICRLVRIADGRALNAVREAGVVASLRETPPNPSSVPACGRVFLDQPA